MKKSVLWVILLGFPSVGMIAGAFAHNLFLICFFAVFFVFFTFYFLWTEIGNPKKKAKEAYEKFRQKYGYDVYKDDFLHYIEHELNNRQLMNLYRGLELERKDNFSEHASGTEEQLEQKLNKELDYLLDAARKEIVHRVDEEYSF